MSERYETELNFYSRHSRSKSKHQIFSLNEGLSTKFRDAHSKHRADVAQSKHSQPKVKALVDDFRQLNNLASSQPRGQASLSRTPERVQKQIAASTQIASPAKSKVKVRRKEEVDVAGFPLAQTRPTPVENRLDEQPSGLSDSVIYLSYAASEGKAHNPHTRDESIKQSERCFDQISSIYRYPSEQEEVNNSQQYAALTQAVHGMQVLTPHSGYEQEGGNPIAETGRFGSPQAHSQRLTFEDTFCQPASSQQATAEPAPLEIRLAVSVSLDNPPETPAQSSRRSPQRINEPLSNSFEAPGSIVRLPEQQHVASSDGDVKHLPIEQAEGLSFKERVERRLSQANLGKDELPQLIEVESPAVNELESTAKLEEEMEFLYSEAFSKAPSQAREFRPFQRALDKLSSLRARILAAEALPGQTRQRLLGNHASISDTLSSQQQIIQSSRRQLQSRLDDLAGSIHLASGGIDWRIAAGYLEAPQDGSPSQEIAINKLMLHALVGKLAVLVHLIRDDRFF